MKNIISIIVVLIVVLSCFAVADAEVPKAYGDENEIWSYLAELSPTEEIAAGIMGFMFRESRLKADAIAGWNLRDEGFCEDFAEEIDKGLKDGSSKEKFIQKVRECGGYGLGQWLDYSYLESFYDYMAKHSESIVDVKSQCEFAVQSIKSNEELWDELLTCISAIQCGRRIGMMYDGTSAEGAEAIASFSDYYFKEMR